MTTSLWYIYKVFKSMVKIHIKWEGKKIDVYTWISLVQNIVIIDVMPVIILKSYEYLPTEDTVCNVVDFSYSLVLTS